MCGRISGFHWGQKIEAAIGKEAEDKEHFIFYKISKWENKSIQACFRRKSMFWRFWDFLLPKPTWAQFHYDSYTDRTATMRMPHHTQISDEQVLLFNQIKGDISKEIKGHKTEITQDPCRPTTLALSEKL